MNSSLFSTFFATLFALVAITQPAFAAGKKKSSPPPLIHETVLSNVGPNSVTVNDGVSTKTLTVTQFTEITVNGQRGNIADLKPGMKVNVTIGTDASRASRINAFDKK